MILLLNGVLTKSKKGKVIVNYDNFGNKIGPAYHQTILEYHNSGENFKVYSRGNMYVLNYNKETYKPLTRYHEYLHEVRDGKNVKVSIIYDVFNKIRVNQHELKVEILEDIHFTKL